MFARSYVLKSELFTPAAIRESAPAMLDIRVIREQADEVMMRLKARGGDHWKLIAEVLACDEARRAAETSKQELQNKRKTISKQIGMMKAKGEDSSAIEAEVRGVGFSPETAQHQHIQILQQGP